MARKKNKPAVPVSGAKTATAAAPPEIIPWFAPITVMALLPLLLFSRALFGTGLIIGTARDIIHQHLAWRIFGFSQLRQGHLPLWNPHIYGGAPFFGGFQSALLYPPNWLHLFLAANTAINWYVALHLFLAGLFTYIWCRGRGASVLGAGLGGVVFMLSGPYYLHIYAGHLPQLGAMVWAPLVFWAVDRWAENGNAAALLWGMAAASLQILSGSPQHVYYTALVAGIYCFARPKDDWRRALTGFVILYVSSSLLTAVQLWTGLQAALESVRNSGGDRYFFAASFSLPQESLLSAAVPFIFGNDATSPFFGRTYLWECCLFVGASSLSLAALELTGPDKSPRFLWILLGAAVCLALGAHTPLFSVLYAALPGFKLFRGTAKFGLFIALALAAAAAAGFDRLRSLQDPSRAARWAAALGAALLLGGWLLPGSSGRSEVWDPVMRSILASRESYKPPFAFTDPVYLASSAQQASEQLAKAGVFFLLSAALLFLARRQREWSRYGLAVLVAAELLSAAWPMSATTPMPDTIKEPWQSALAAHQPERRVLDGYPGTANVGMTVGLDGVWGYDPIVQRRYAEFVSATQGIVPEQATQYVTFTSTPAIYNLLRVGDDALPRVSLVRNYEIVQEPHQRLSILLSRGFDPRKTVLLEETPEPEPVPGDGGGVKVLDAVPGRFDVEADVPSPALLLITDSYSAGWRATPLEPGPQSRYDILPADHAFQAIALAKGRHHLRLQYAPGAFRFGLWISWAALAAYAAAWAVLLLRPRPAP